MLRMGRNKYSTHCIYALCAQRVEYNFDNL